MSKFSSLVDKFPYVYKFTNDGWEVSYKENDSIITKPVPEAIDDYFKKSKLTSLMATTATWAMSKSRSIRTRPSSRLYISKESIGG